MQNRRTVLGILAALLSGLRAKTQPTSRGVVKELARHELKDQQAEREAILVEVTAFGGQPSTIHRHPGFVLGYVLDGEMLFAVNKESPSLIKTGDTFFEPFGVIHTTGASAKPNAPVRFLAFIVAPKGSPVVLPA